MNRIARVCVGSLYRYRAMRGTVKNKYSQGAGAFFFVKCGGEFSVSWATNEAGERVQHIIV